MKSKNQYCYSVASHCAARAAGVRLLSPLLPYCVQTPQHCFVCLLLTNVDPMYSTMIPLTSRLGHRNSEQRPAYGGVGTGVASRMHATLHWRKACRVPVHSRLANGRSTNRLRLTAGASQTPNTTNCTRSMHLLNLNEKSELCSFTEKAAAKLTVNHVVNVLCILF